MSSHRSKASSHTVPALPSISTSNVSRISSRRWRPWDRQHMTYIDVVNALRWPRYYSKLKSGDNPRILESKTKMENFGYIYIRNVHESKNCNGNEVWVLYCIVLYCIGAVIMKSHNFEIGVNLLPAQTTGNWRVEIGWSPGTMHGSDGKWQVIKIAV